MTRRLPSYLVPGLLLAAALACFGYALGPLWLTAAPPSPAVTKFVQCWVSNGASYSAYTYASNLTITRHQLDLYDIRRGGPVTFYNTPCVIVDAANP